jgi:hypothetical protein
VTTLQQLLIQVSDEAQRPDPRRMADEAMSGADRRRRRGYASWALGSTTVVAMVIAAAVVVGRGALAVGGSDGDVLGGIGSGGQVVPTFFEGPPRDRVIRALLAIVFALTTGFLVGRRERARGGVAPVRLLERLVGALWGASLALWVFATFETLRMLGRDRFLGHPYITIVSHGALPVLAVLLLCLGSAAVRRLALVGLAAEAVVNLSLLYTWFGQLRATGASHWGFALAVAQMIAALGGVASMSWSRSLRRVSSPLWPLAVCFLAAGVVLVNLFLYSADDDVVPFRPGTEAKALSWAAAGCAIVLIGCCLWRACDSAAGAAVVLGLLVYVGATFALTAYPNTLPSLRHDWGPYLDGWFLAGVALLACLLTYGWMTSRAAPGVPAAVASRPE